jgi:hypothetical protein
MGVDSMFKVFDESYYQELKGGMLESFGRLFKNNVKIMVYPGIRNDQVITCDQISLPEHQHPLYDYLCRNLKIVHLNASDISHLGIFSDKVLQMIRQNKQGWQNLVPRGVAESVMVKKLFDYPG